MSDPNATLSSPALSHLLSRFLKNRMQLQTAGLHELETPTSEVEPHQAVAALGVDVTAALREAMSASSLLPTDARAGFTLANLRSLPEWSTVVRMRGNLAAIPYCLGNYPQLLQEVLPLLQRQNLQTMLPNGSERAIGLESVTAWGLKRLQRGHFAEAAIAAGVLRGAAAFADAENLLTELQRSGSEWTPLLQNEAAALQWHRGRLEEAQNLWARHPIEEHPVIQFNRGMSALFCGRRPEARGFLAQAVEQLPSESPWHHLAQLYLAL